MKKLLLIILLTSMAFAQFKDSGSDKIDIHKGIYNNTTSGFFSNFFSSDRFSMKHSFEMSYSAAGQNGLALGVYTNQMAFKFADNLTFLLDASLVNSPYNTFGDNFTKSINGVYITRAQLNYKLSESTNISVQYRSYPTGGGFYRPYGYYNNYFNDFMFPDE